MIIAIVIALIQGLIIFLGFFLVGHFVKLAITIARSPRQHWDSLDRVRKVIQSGRVSSLDDQEIRKGLAYKEKTGEWIFTAKPARGLYERILR